MAQGPGKYDAQCTRTLHEVDAECVILIVIHGRLGSGFSVSCTTPHLLPTVPDALRQCADAVAVDLRRDAS